MSSTDSKISKTQANFQTLTSAASSLNTASDELTKVVGKLDEALRKLNVGLSDWVTFESHSDDERDPLRYDCDQIGYSKVNGKWGIAVRHIWGHEAYDDSHNEDGPWLFNDAPREMRLRSVGKIPELIESLGKKASDTAKKIQEKTKEVDELALAIEEVSKAKHTRLVDQVLKANALAAVQEVSKATVSLRDLLGRDAKEGGK